MKSKVLAVFDFDGTITTKDTLFLFIRFYHGKCNMCIGLLLLSPVLIAYKIHIISNKRVKEILIAYFFGDENFSKFCDMCKRYSKEIDGIANIEAIERIRWHQQHGDEVVIVSASLELWIKPWGDLMNVKVMGTQVEVNNGLIGRRFITPNCYGIEKVNRLLAVYPDRNDYILYSYGDSKGDYKLFEISDYSFYRRFK